MPGLIAANVAPIESVPKVYLNIIACENTIKLLNYRIPAIAIILFSLLLIEHVGFSQIPQRYYATASFSKDAVSYFERTVNEVAAQLKCVNTIQRFELYHRDDFLFRLTLDNRVQVSTTLIENLENSSELAAVAALTFSFNEGCAEQTSLKAMNHSTKSLFKLVVFEAPLAVVALATAVVGVVTLNPGTILSIHDLPKVNHPNDMEILFLNDFYQKQQFIDALTSAGYSPNAYVSLVKKFSENPKLFNKYFWNGFQELIPSDLKVEQSRPEIDPAYIAYQKVVTDKVHELNLREKERENRFLHNFSYTAHAKHNQPKYFLERKEYKTAIQAQLSLLQRSPLIYQNIYIGELQKMIEEYKRTPQGVDFRLLLPLKASQKELAQITINCSVDILSDGACLEKMGDYYYRLMDYEVAEIFYGVAENKKQRPSVMMGPDEYKDSRGKWRDFYLKKRNVYILQGKYDQAINSNNMRLKFYGHIDTSDFDRLSLAKKRMKYSSKSLLYAKEQNIEPKLLKYKWDVVEVPGYPQHD